MLDADPDAGLVAAGHLVFTDPQQVSSGELAFKLGPADAEYVLELSGPVGQPLRVGTYEHAGRMINRDPGQPGLDLYGRSVACNEVDGRFVVDDITRDAASTVTSFAAQFEIHCVYGDGAVFGTISYHSAIVYPERSISPAQLTFSATIGDRTASQRVVVTNTGATTLTEAFPTIDGPQASDFRVAATTCGGPLPPGQSCALDVDFALTAPIDPDAGTNRTRPRSGSATSWRRQPGPAVASR